MPAHYIPKGYHTMTPYLVVKGAAEAIEFYKQVFGAMELLRMASPDGKVGHAELKVGDSHIMLADEFRGMGCLSPKSLGGSPVSLLVYVPDADAVFSKAVAQGATIKHPIKNQFYGDRSGGIQDPFGHVWMIATHIEDVPPDELNRRAQEAMKQCSEHEVAAGTA